MMVGMMTMAAVKVMGDCGGVVDGGRVCQHHWGVSISDGDGGDGDNGGDTNDYGLVVDGSSGHVCEDRDVGTGD